MDMEYRYLGRSGLKVSALSYGAWVTFGDQVDIDAAEACMRAAYDAGVNFFDNAEIYAKGQAELHHGRRCCKPQSAGAAQGPTSSPRSSSGAAKAPTTRGLSRKHIVEGTQAALERLGVDYVDLLFCHRPDLHTPIEETVWAMHHLVQNGLALYWGTSEWSAAQIRRAHDVARREHLIPPTMEQPQYNMFHRDRVEAEYAPLYEEIGLGTTVWSPLASGVLTGKYNDGLPEGSRFSLKDYQWLRPRLDSPEGQARLAKVAALKPVAEELDCSLAQLALAWCLSNDDVSTVITGASRPEQVVENMKAMEVAARLTPELLERIEGILDNRPRGELDWREL